MIKYKDQHIITYPEIKRMPDLEGKLWYQKADFYYDNPEEFHKHLDIYQFADDLCEDLSHLSIYQTSLSGTNNLRWDYPKKCISPIDILDEKFPDHFLTKFFKVYVTDNGPVYVLIWGCGECEDQLIKFNSWGNYLKEITNDRTS